MPIWLPKGIKPTFGQEIDWLAWVGVRPVGAWMMLDGNASPRLTDISGNLNHGTLTGMDPATDWVPTKQGMGLDFDGTDDRVVVTTSPNAFSTNAVTVMVGVSYRGLPGTSPFIADLFSTEYTGQTGYSLRWGTGGNGNFQFAVPSRTAYYEKIPTFGKIYNVIGTYDKVTVRVYLDGKEGTPASSTSAFNYAAGVFGIGAGPIYTTRATNGQILYAVLWTDALSQTAIDRLQGSIPIRQPQRYWPSAGGGLVGKRYRNVRLRNWRLP